MGFHFNFRSLESTQDLKDLIDFLAAQDLGYPKYDEWVQRTESELIEGHKNSIIAFSESNLVGNVVYQRHKNLPSILELKNIRIHPELRQRYFAKFMLRQVEAENEGKYDAIMVDARQDQKEVIRFLGSCNYSQTLTIPLYDSNVPDIIMTKFLRENENPLSRKIKNFVLNHAK